MHGCGVSEKKSKKSSSSLTVTHAVRQKKPFRYSLSLTVLCKKNCLQNNKLRDSDFFGESSTSAPPVQTLADSFPVFVGADFDASW